MAYLSLYRKYRSQSFDELFGQDHITRTLRNALRSGKVGHAYLFCGPRGTGKTSTARLLARALNCRNGPTPDPCNECDACIEIAEGRHLDVHEIDAASNRGIDSVRALRDTVAFAPVSGRYKVYIIDEAHQITSEAFNAFLKTLEEPPPTVVFVMATTSAEKMPITIRSRCQRFDFRRGSLELLRERISYVAAQEGAEIDAGAVDLIARDARGGWRDALSLLEQVLAFGEGRVTAKDVYSILGSVEAEALFQLASDAVAQDGSGVFRRLEALVAEGKDPAQLLDTITSFFRSMMLATATGAEGVDQDGPRRLELARRYGRARLITAIEILAHAQREARWAEDPRLLLELALVRIMYPRSDTPIEPRPDVGMAEARAAAPTADAVRPERAPARTESPSRPSSASPSPVAGGTGERSAPRGQPRTSPAVEPQPAAATATTPAPPPAGESLGAIRAKWRAIREDLQRSNKRNLYIFLTDAVPHRMEDGVLILNMASRGFAEEFQRRSREFSVPLSESIERVTGVRCDVKAWYGDAAPAAAAPPTAAAPAAVTVDPRRRSDSVATEKSAPTEAGPTPSPEAPDDVLRGPALVNDVIETFSGRLQEDLDFG